MTQSAMLQRIINRLRTMQSLAKTDWELKELAEDLRLLNKLKERIERKRP